jgi:GGDEF domain-containing protein
LAILIELGVAYGQGYLMGKPADDLRGVPRQTREFIQERNALYGKMSLGRRVAIGELARRTVEMPTDTPLGVAAAKFARDATLTSVVVLEEERPRGLLMRNQLDHVLDLAKAAQLAALLPDDTIEQWIRTNLLFVQASVSIQEAAHQLTTRSDLSMETDIVVVNSENEYVGVVSPRLLLEHALMVQENQRRYADSLTGLPNRVALEQEINSRLNERQPMAVLYADLTGFRLYNQAFGAAHGDEVLYEMKRLCLHALEQGAGGDGYLAHLSGDDFILMTEPSAGQAVGRALIAGFEPLLKQFYREEQWRQGHIELEERNGNRRNVPLMRLHVVGLTSAKSRLTHYGQIMEDLYRLMQQAQRNANARLMLDDGR